MACYRSILVALDGSPDADAALRHAVVLARDQHARLTLLAVAPPAVTPTSIDFVAPTQDFMTAFDGVLRRAVSEIPGDIGVTTRLMRGEAAKTILQVARDEQHDLIVMGSHGHGRVHRALLGSVSERLLHHSPVPVLLMHAGLSEVAAAEAAAQPLQQSQGQATVPLTEGVLASSKVAVAE